MALITKEYLRSIVPEDLPDGKKILQEGIELGKTIKSGEPKFLEYAKELGYSSIEEFIKGETDKGKVMFTVNTGLATLEEQVELLKELRDFCEENDILAPFPICIPDMNVAIPAELRGEDMETTGFMLDTTEEYRALQSIDRIMPSIGNQVLFVPDALNTCIKCVETGNLNVGTTCELSWNFPGCENHVKYVIETLKGLGILAQKRDEGFMVAGYTEDGIGGNCVDCVSFMGYLFFERYIYEDLCGVSFNGCGGGLVSDVRYKAALLKAQDMVCKTEDHHGVGMSHGTTTVHWDHDVQTNFGPIMQEMMFMILAEKHYKTGAALIPVPVTEAIAVPTTENIKSVICAAARMVEFAEQWEGSIDFTEIDRIADVLVEKGRKMFENFMADLKKAGIDTEDPLQLLMIIKNINPSLWEETYHPSIEETGHFKPYFPNDMGKMVEAAFNEKMEELKAKGYEDCLKGKKVLVASLDGHVYGMRYVNDVLTNLGAEVVVGGVDNTPQSVLDIAEEEGIQYIGVSTHNSQSLVFAEQLKALMDERGKDYTVFMGGILNTILPGHSEPSDVTELINRKGVIADNNIESAVKAIMES